MITIMPWCMSVFVSLCGIFLNFLIHNGGVHQSESIPLSEKSNLKITFHENLI